MQFHFEIIDKLIAEKPFWRYYFLSPYCIDDSIEIDDETWFYCGATRGCIVSEKYNFAIKFVFDDGNECEREREIYSEACKYDLNKYFVPCHYLGSYDKDVMAEDWDSAASKVAYSNDPDDWDNLQETNLYSQHIHLELYGYDKIDDECWKDYVLSPEEKNFCNNSNSPLIERSYQVGVSFLREYGIAAFDALSKFCRKWEINDLHCGNIAMLNGHTVIMDYAGYWR